MKPWATKKNHLGLDFPNLPYLIDGEVRLTESKSIMKYFCRKHRPEMLGRTPDEVAVADMVSRVHDDLHKKFGGYCFSEKGDCAELQTDLADAAGKLARFLMKKSFVVGEQLTYVDFSIFELLDFMNYASKGKTFSEHPSLKEYFDRVKQLPGFAEYWNDDEKCPKTGFKPWFATFGN